MNFAEVFIALCILFLCVGYLLITVHQLQKQLQNIQSDSTSDELNRKLSLLEEYLGIEFKWFGPKYEKKGHKK